jgi:hypothetical protein
MRKRDASIFAIAFLDGFSLAGFFRPLRRPGAPTQLFADPEPKNESLSMRTDSPVQENGVISPAEIERAKRLLSKAGFRVVPETPVGLTEH